MCGSMADIQSPTAEIRRGKKEERRTNDSMKIYMLCPITRRATIKNKINQISYRIVSYRICRILRSKVIRFKTYCPDTGPSTAVVCCIWVELGHRYPLMGWALRLVHPPRCTECNYVQMFFSGPWCILPS